MLSTRLLASILVITCRLDPEEAMTRSIRPATGCCVFSALLFAALAGCGSGGSGNCAEPANVGGDASAQDGAASDARGCLGTAPLCASGTEGGECGDWLTDAQCIGSTWKCPTGTIAASLCGCFDWQPTCSPGTAGGACGSETVSPICAGGHWSCPDGTVSSDDCACVLSGDGGAASDGGCP
jgi:hypothetical protein